MRVHGLLSQITASGGNLFFPLTLARLFQEYALYCIINSMKRSELLFNVISVPLDFLMILAAASIAYFLRYRVETLPVLFELSYHQYLQFVLVGIPFLLLLFALNGLYVQKSTRGFWRETGNIVWAVSAGLMIVVVLFFFNKNLFPSRLIILMGWALAIILVGLGRGLLLILQRRLLAKGTGRHKLIVITSLTSHQIVDEIENDTRLGYEIAAKIPYTSNIMETVENLHRQKRVDEILQADTRLSNEETLNLVTICEDLGIKFNYVPSILESHRSNFETDVIGSMPVIRLRNTPLDGWGKVVKRFTDISVALAGMILFLPALIFIPLAIKLDTKGSVFFRQLRGSSLHSFQLYKFRTMRAELSEGTAEGDRIRRELEQQNSRHGPYVKIKNDPRVTRVGRFLRKTKLDELPQLWHVLRGQMSLVGPRIHMIKEVEKFENQHKKIFTIKRGLTGLAQINQFSNPELPFEEEIKLDLFYIENWSFWLDIYIIFKTIILLFTKRQKENY